MNSIEKMGREVGGTFKEPSFVSMVASCWTENVDSSAKQQLSMIVQAKMGRIFITILTSSTCCTEHCSAPWGGLSTTALLRNLRLSVGDSMDSIALAFDDSSSLKIGVEGEGLVVILAMALLELLGLQVFMAAAISTCPRNHVFQLLEMDED